MKSRPLLEQMLHPKLRVWRTKDGWWVVDDEASAEHHICYGAFRSWQEAIDKAWALITGEIPC